MPGRIELEVFERVEPVGETVELSRGDLEEERLAAFERGYAAGWEDAVAAQDAEVQRVRADISRTIEDLSFTYHEAHRHVLRALEPLLKDMVGKVLPAIARETLGQIVLEHILPSARAAAGAPIEVVVSPAGRGLVEPALAAQSALPLTLREDPDLADGEVLLRLANGETRVDLDGVIGAIGQAVSAFFRFGEDLPAKEGQVHG